MTATVIEAITLAAVLWLSCTLAHLIYSYML